MYNHFVAVSLLVSYYQFDAKFHFPDVSQNIFEKMKMKGKRLVLIQGINYDDQETEKNMATSRCNSTCTLYIPLRLKLEHNQDDISLSGKQSVLDISCIVYSNYQDK